MEYYITLVFILSSLYNDSGMPWTWALLLLILAFLVRLPFLLQSGNIVDFDEATFALMAKRILEGEIPLYVSGHSYSGSFISFLMAPFLALLGNAPLAVRLPPLVLFLVFLLVNYLLLKKMFSKAVGIFATLFLIVMPAGVFDISMRAWGGHAELWSFWAAALLLLFLYFNSSHSGNFLMLFGIGFISGAALWIGEIFVLFLVPSVLYWIARGKAWNFIRVKNTAIPPWLRWIFIGAHAIIGLYLAVQLINLFFGVHPQPPFRIKELKKITVLLISEITVTWIFTPSRSEEYWLKGKKMAATVSGILLGHLPAVLFNSLGGEGLRIFHKSGAITCADLPTRLSDIFAHKIPHFVLGLSYFDFPSKNFFGWGLLVLILFMVLFTALSRASPRPVLIYYGLGAMTVFANIASTLEAKRYMAPLYLALAVIMGVFLGQIAWRKSKFLSVFLAFLIGSGWSYTDYRFYQELPKDRRDHYRQILDYLESRGIQGGQGSRSITHLLTFLSGERIVFSTYLQQERYLPHALYTEKLWRRAYVFGKTDSALQNLEKDPALFSKVTQKTQIGDFVIYIVEMPEKREAGVDVSYLEWRPRPKLHFYLNQ